MWPKWPVCPEMTETVAFCWDSHLTAGLGQCVTTKKATAMMTTTHFVISFVTGRASYNSYVFNNHQPKKRHPHFCDPLL